MKKNELLNLIKISFIKCFKIQKFTIERIINSKVTKEIKDVKKWAEIHQKYELSESVSNGHIEDEILKQKYYSLILEIPFFYDFKNKSVLDIGGGPNSILLRSKNFSRARIVDPGNYSKEVVDNYYKNNIEYVKQLAENYNSTEKFDEVLIYNVLQHTVNTEKIIKNALDSATERIRFFDWGYTKPTLGHPQTITKKYILDKFKKDGWKWKKFNESFINDENLKIIGWAIWGIFEKE